MFLNILSLHLHFQIANMIEEKYSVKNVLLIRSRIKMYRIDRSGIMSETTRKENELASKLNIDLDLLRKIL